MLLPASVEECYEMAMDAFDLSERLQTIIYVMSDLDLGMNTWMAQPFTYPDKPIDRGKVLDEAKVRELGASWGRYKDVDGDGDSVAIAARHRRAGVSSRAARATTRWRSTPSGRTTTSRTSIGWRASSTRRRRSCRRPSSSRSRARKVGIIAFGSSHWAVEEVARSAARGVGPRRPRTSGCARIRSRPRSTSSSASTIASTSSSRTATRRC